MFLVRSRKMKTLRITIYVLFSIVVCLPYAAGQNEKAASPALTWRDAETREVLFTSDDVISFDWDKQVFLLDRDATHDFLAWIPPHMHQAQSLVVENTRGDIYDAVWVNSISSMAFSGPVYEPLSPNPFFSITNGYPDGYPRDQDQSMKERDPRFDPRLKKGLERAGVLGSIDLNRKWVGLLIQTTGHRWKDVGEDMKIRVEYFENTFQRGEKARAHVFFAGGKKTRKQIDSLTFKITFIANEGTFRSDISKKRVPVSETEDGIYVCKFAPWESVEGSDEKVELGSGRVSLSILLQKQNKTVYRLDFPSYRRVPIGGVRAQAESTDTPGTK